MWDHIEYNNPFEAEHEQLFGVKRMLIVHGMMTDARLLKTRTYNPSTAAVCHTKCCLSQPLYLKQVSPKWLIEKCHSFSFYPTPSDIVSLFSSSPSLPRDLSWNLVSSMLEMVPRWKDEWIWWMCVWETSCQSFQTCIFGCSKRKILTAEICGIENFVLFDVWLLYFMHLINRRSWDWAGFFIEVNIYEVDCKIEIPRHSRAI